ncbi:MAG: quinol:cytochrome C oxidoreductase [Planctomycetes bacterium]|nr:quinol:cytochrome C oxidoreductase [Planctomycetota bacterium]MCB9888136.1 quinol:cytochrome C oxidoreductase [Planctomycetota bacterium]
MTATTIPPVESYAPGTVTRAPEGSLSGSASLLLGLGAVSLLGSLGGYFMLDHDTQEHFQFSYLVSYMFTLSLALGALFFVLVQHVARAGWSIVVRRIAENMTASFVALFVLFIPVILFSDTLFAHWMHADLDPKSPGFDALIAAKSGYLNKPFFFSRAAAYFAIWLGLAWFFRSRSLAQDENGNPAVSLTLARTSAPGLILFGLAITFAAFDWMMSLNPHWFSTMFGVTYFAGAEMSFLALLALFCLWLRKKQLLSVVNTEHYHDIGKLMFAFMVFWSYVNFSQYFLIQYADLPEETVWFQARRLGNWPLVGAALVIGHFMVPFVFLLSRHIKRSRLTLAVAAVFLLFMHWVDMHFVIMPNHADHFSLSWFDVTTLLGTLCVFLGLTVRGVASTNLIPVRDPKLRESMRFVNI